MKPGSSHMYHACTVSDFVQSLDMHFYQVDVAHWLFMWANNECFVLSSVYTETNPDMIVANTITSYVTFTTSGEPSAQLTFQVWYHSFIINLSLFLSFHKYSMIIWGQGELKVGTILFLCIQVHGICLLRRLRLEGDPLHFLVETWSDCSGSTHHQGPLMLEPTIVNSTVTLVIPHLLPKCHVTARVQNQRVLNCSNNINFG